MRKPVVNRSHICDRRRNHPIGSGQHRWNTTTLITGCEISVVGNECQDESTVQSLGNPKNLPTDTQPKP